MGETFYNSETIRPVFGSNILALVRLLWGWLMRGKVKWGIYLSTVCALVSVCGFAQSGTDNRRTSPTRAPNRNSTTNSTTLQQPVFFAGKVVLDTGTEPPSPVAIIRSCNGLSRRQTYSATDGSFSFMVGDSNNYNDMAQDASTDSRGFSADSQLSRTNVSSNGLAGSQAMMADCELRAELPGYSSSLIRLDPSMNNSNVGVIVLHNRAKKADGMVTVASLAVPPKARKEYEKGSELLEKGNLAEAEKSLRKAIDEYPKFGEAWTRLGDLEQRRKNRDAAMKDYEEAVAADPNLPVPYLRMAFLEAVASHWEQTRQLTDKLISLDPTDFTLAYYYNAAAEFNLQHYGRAEASALRAESMDKAHAEPRIELLLASIYTAKQSYSAAADHYRAYLKLDPDGPLTERVKTDLAKTEEMAKSQAPPNPSANK